jgi:hypothetical protein
MQSTFALLVVVAVARRSPAWLLHSGSPVLRQKPEPRQVGGGGNVGSLKKELVDLSQP